MINSPGELLFQQHLLKGELFKRGVIQEGELFFRCHLFTFDRTKFISKACSVKERVHDGLPGELFEGGGVTFSMSVPRGEGGGGLIERESYSRKYGTYHLLMFLQVLAEDVVVQVALIAENAQ